MAEALEADWNQVHLLPAQIEDWISFEHEARYIRSFVDELNLSKLGFPEYQGGGRGRPPYATRLLLRAWLYGYLRKVRSSRKLERACQEEMGFIWLCGTLKPDHNSLWRFWHKHRPQIKKIFLETVKIAADLDLIGYVTQAVDGTKIQAVCSSRGGHGKEGLASKLEKVDAVIAELEQQIEAQPSSVDEPPLAKLPKELTDARTLRQKIRSAQAAIESGEAKYVQPKEPEARRMNTHRSKTNTFGYNAQTVVDAKHQIITAAEVVTDSSDSGQLDSMIDLSDENTEQPSEVILADGGYSSGQQIAQAQEKDRDVIMPLPSRSKNPDDKPYHSSRFKYDAERELVLCPEGHELYRINNTHKEKVGIRLFRNTKACKGCPVRSRCTKQKCGRVIEIHTYHKNVEAHREKMTEERSKALYKERAGIVEPPFAWIKVQDQFTRWTVNGLENTRAQWNWICTSQNLRKIIKAMKEKSETPLNRHTRGKIVSTARLNNSLIPLRCFFPHKHRKATRYPYAYWLKRQLTVTLHA